MVLGRQFWILKGYNIIKEQFYCSYDILANMGIIYTHMRLGNIHIDDIITIYWGIYKATCFQLENMLLCKNQGMCYNDSLQL